MPLVSVPPLSTEPEPPPQKGAVKRVAGKVVGKVVGHVKAKRDFTISTWLIYVVVALGLIGLVYGVVQQFRVWRLDKIRKAAEIRINDLKLDVEQAELRVKKKFYTGQLKINTADTARVDARLKEIRNKKAKIVKDANWVSPSRLKQLFRGEKK